MSLASLQEIRFPTGTFCHLSFKKEDSSSIYASSYATRKKYSLPNLTVIFGLLLLLSFPRFSFTWARKYLESFFMYKLRRVVRSINIICIYDILLIIEYNPFVSLLHKTFVGERVIK